MRPIICICNDPYVPSLRELRKEALILHFNGIDRSRLTARLEEVCRMNQVEVRYDIKVEDDFKPKSLGGSANPENPRFSSTNPIFVIFLI